MTKATVQQQIFSLHVFLVKLADKEMVVGSNATLEIRSTREGNVCRNVQYLGEYL